MGAASDSTELGVPSDPAPGPRERPSVSVPLALGEPFRNEHWLSRTLVASAWLLIPIVGFVVVRGWAAVGFTRMLQHHPDPFPRPRLSDLRIYLRHGAPSASVLLASLALLGFSALAGVGLINAGLWATVLSGGTLALTLLATAIVLATVLLGWVLLLGNAILTRAEISGRLGQALAPGSVWPQARNAWARTLFAYSLFVPLALLLLTVGASVGCLGALPVWVILELASTHLRYQIYERQTRGGVPRLAAPVPKLLPSEARMVSSGKLEARTR